MPRTLMTQANAVKSALRLACKLSVRNAEEWTFDGEARLYFDCESDGNWRVERWHVEREGDFSIDASRRKHKDGRIRDSFVAASHIPSYASWLIRQHPDIAADFGVEGAVALTELYAAGGRWALRKSEAPKRLMRSLGIVSLGEIANLAIFSDMAAVTLKTAEPSLSWERL